MNLLFRFLIILLTANRRGRLSILNECLTPFLVLPTDLDPLMHMNNGKYWSLMDLGRIDFLIRSGIWPRLSEKKWYPVVVSETMRFKKSLKLFDRFEISSRTLGWDDRYIYVEQMFLHNKEVCALGLVKARFLKREGGAVNPSEILGLIDQTIQSPSLDNFLSAWQHAEKEHLESRGIYKNSKPGNDFINA